MASIPFCDLCGRILKITTEDNQTYGLCSCGFRRQTEIEISFTQKSPEKEELGKGIISEETSLKGFPHICIKCSHDQCEIFDLGAQYSDESNIYLYKCKKCGFTERQADGSSNA